MKRGTILVLMGVLLLTFFFAQIHNGVNLAGRVVDDLRGESSRASISAEVLDKAEKGNDVRIFVNLKDSKDSRSKSSKKEIAESFEGKVKHVFEDKVSMIVSESELLELQNNPNIESIELVKMRQTSLQDSVPLINATSTWSLQLDGINLTGAGQTICIIDTGVDYNHADFGNCYGDNNVSSDCQIIGGIDYCADDTNCITTDTDPMDVHGHGTHVAGIAAANGAIKGVAPDAKIIMIKAGNGTGTFWDDDLEKAMNWCIDNASIFNISVISMSLGGKWGITTHCDSQDALTNEVNAAVAAGISVVAATGNEGLTDEIHGPACITNVTPIGGTTKGDVVVYNRNNLTLLVAPGVSINSTEGTSYSTKSGTSMSTPHAAGVIALINQYLTLIGDSLTPSEIETILSDTGVRIYDSGSGLNYSRIDVYSAIISLDSISPNVTLISPNTGSVSYNENQTFSCNVSEDLNLESLTFSIWNSTDLVNQTTINVSGQSYTLEINQTLVNESYSWNCEGIDEGGNVASAGSNYTIRMGEMDVLLISPLDDTYTNSNETTFNCSAEDGLNLTNVTIYIWNSTGILIHNDTNTVTGWQNNSVFIYNLSEEMNFSWNCEFVNEDSISNIASANYTITLDSTNPDVSLEGPGDGNTVTDGDVDFDYIPEDTQGIERCVLYIDAAIEETDTSINAGSTNTFSNVALDNDDYVWEIKCYDLAGNSYTSNERDLTVDESSSGDSSDDSSDDSDSTTTSTSSDDGPSLYYLNSTQLEGGINRSIKVRDLIKFNISDEAHTLKLDSASVNQIKVTISSDPVSLTININETGMADIDNDNVYDVEVGYPGAISSLYYRLSIKEVSIPVPTRQISNDTNSSDDEVEPSVSSWKKITGKVSAFWSSTTNKIIVYSLMGVLLLGGLGFLVYKKRNVVIEKVVSVLSKSQSGLNDMKSKKGGIAISNDAEVNPKTLKKHSKKKKKKANDLSRDDFKNSEYF